MSGMEQDAVPDELPFPEFDEPVDVPDDVLPVPILPRSAVGVAVAFLPAMAGEWAAGTDAAEIAVIVPAGDLPSSEICLADKLA